MRERLHAFAIDERPVPELEIHKAPQAIAAVRAPGSVIAEERVDRRRVDDAALARPAIE